MLPVEDCRLVCWPSGQYTTKMARAKQHITLESTRLHEIDTLTYILHIYYYSLRVTKDISTLF
jgi:hypothetical protein